MGEEIAAGEEVDAKQLAQEGEEDNEEDKMFQNRQEAFQREPSEDSDNFNEELLDGWDKMLADPIYE